MLDLLAQIIVDVVAFMFSGLFSERMKARVNEDISARLLRFVLAILAILAAIAIFVGAIFLLVRIVAGR
jgi:uncharacterized membrane protein